MDANFSFFGCSLTVNDTNYIFAAWFSVSLLFLPVFLFVLYIGFNKWKKHQSSASGGLSHSDVFTLHMVVIEMICIVGSCAVVTGFFSSIKSLILPTENVFTIVYTGQILFHSLTCMERYLAVVHPVTYLSLRGKGGVTVRNISIALVWGLSVSFCLIGIYSLKVRQIYFFILILLVIPQVIYCSVYVLWVLTRPKPGDGDRRQIDHSKRSTVYTMVAILGAILMRLIVSVIYFCFLYMVERIDICLIGVVGNWFCLPSSLVLPLLFLHRAGKLSGFCKE